MSNLRQQVEAEARKIVDAWKNEDFHVLETDISDALFTYAKRLQEA